jgi:hypothetical protein
MFKFLALVNNKPKDADIDKNKNGPDEDDSEFQNALIENDETLDVFHTLVSTLKDVSVLKNTILANGYTKALSDFANHNNVISSMLPSFPAVESFKEDLSVESSKPLIADLDIATEGLIERIKALGGKVSEFISISLNVYRWPEKLDAMKKLEEAMHKNLLEMHDGKKDMIEEKIEKHIMPCIKKSNDCIMAISKHASEFTKLPEASMSNLVMIGKLCIKNTEHCKKLFEKYSDMVTDMEDRITKPKDDEDVHKYIHEIDDMFRDILKPVRKLSYELKYLCAEIIHIYK